MAEQKLFADGLTTAEQIAAMYNGIYAPTYTTPSPSTPVGGQPSWPNFAAMFGGAAPANPTGYQGGYVKSDNDRLVSPALNYTNTPVAAGIQPAPIIGMPRPRPMQPPQIVGTYPTTAAAVVAAMAGAAPVSAPPRNPAATAPKTAQGAGNKIADMFVPTRAGTNGYVYADNGRGGLMQVGNTRPAGMTPAQQYAAASAALRNPRNAAERMESNGSRFDSNNGDSISG